VGVGFIGLGNYGTGVLSPAFKAAGAAKGAVVPSGGGRGPFRWEAHSVGRQGLQALGRWRRGAPLPQGTQLTPGGAAEWACHRESTRQHLWKTRQVRRPFRWEAHSVGRQGIAGSGEVAAQSEGCMGSLFVARMRGQVLNRRIPARAKGSPLGGRARVVSEGERE